MKRKINTSLVLPPSSSENRTSNQSLSEVRKNNQTETAQQPRQSIVINNVRKVAQPMVASSRKSSANSNKSSVLLNPEAPTLLKKNVMKIAIVP